VPGFGGSGAILGGALCFISSFLVDTEVAEALSLGFVGEVDYKMLNCFKRTSSSFEGLPFGESSSFSSKLESKSFFPGETGEALKGSKLDAPNSSSSLENPNISASSKCKSS
jgi:hypothetical protein